MILYPNETSKHQGNLVWLSVILPVVKSVENIKLQCPAWGIFVCGSCDSPICMRLYSIKFYKA